MKFAPLFGLQTDEEEDWRAMLGPKPLTRRDLQAGWLAFTLIES